MTDTLIEKVAYLVANDDVTRADLVEALATQSVGRMKAEAECDRLRSIPAHYGAPIDDPEAAIRWITGIMDAENDHLRKERDRLEAEVASLRLTLGGRTFSADVPDPIGCPLPGACVQVAEIERLREALRDILQAERWNEEAFRKGCDLERAVSMELMSDTVRIARAALGKDRA